MLVITSIMLSFLKQLVKRNRSISYSTKESRSNDTLGYVNTYPDIFENTSLF